MTHLVKYYPLALGFDSLFDQMDRLLETEQVSYPPYNIVKEDDIHTTIEMAVAGFNVGELEVALEDSVLSISGAEVAKDERKIVHRGIGKRPFIRRFTLSEEMKVNEVTLENGVLRVMLERMVPEHKKRRSFEIKKVGEIPIKV